MALLQELKGERVTIYTVEKQFTGILDEFAPGFSVSNEREFVALKPTDVINIKSLCGDTNIIFVKGHFNF